MCINWVQFGLDNVIQICNKQWTSIVYNIKATYGIPMPKIIPNSAQAAANSIIFTKRSIQYNSLKGQSNIIRVIFQSLFNEWPKKTFQNIEKYVRINTNTCVQCLYGILFVAYIQMVNSLTFYAHTCSSNSADQIKWPICYPIAPFLHFTVQT